jgi:hypothetical protein
VGAMPECIKDIKVKNVWAMNEEVNNRCRWLHLRLTQDEYNLLQLHFKKSTCRKMSEYARRILLTEPVIAGYHNQSLDAFMTEAIRLRKELNSIGNNLNQVVKKLHTMQQIGEFRLWIQAFEGDYERVMADITDIKKLIAKISDLWLQ